MPATRIDDYDDSNRSISGGNFRRGKLSFSRNAGKVVSILATLRYFRLEMA